MATTRRGTWTTIALLTATAVSIGGPALGFELFGVHLWGERPLTAAQPDPENPDAQPYTVDLVTTAPNADQQEALAGVVRNASQLWNARTDKPPASTPALLSALRGETARIVAALRAEAYYGGAVTITIAGRSVDDLKPDERLPQPAPVTIRVETGPPFTFGVVTINGRPPDPVDAADSPRKDTPEKMGLVRGQPARAGVVLATEQMLLAGWRRNGHALPKLAARDVVARHDTHTLDVTIGADPGPATAFGGVAVSGTEHMDAAFVAEQVALPAGAPWDQELVDRAERRLRNLQVFSSARIQPQAQPGPDGRLSMAARVAERPLHAFGFDASHSSLDGIGVGGYWQHRNLFGRAERLKLEARVTGIRSAKPDDFTYLTGATLVQPGMFGPSTNLTSQLLAKREAPETYTQKTVQARSGVVWEMSATTTLSAMVNVEFDKVDDAFGKRNLALFSLPLEASYDGANDKLSPTSGFRVKLGAEPFIESRFGNTGVIAKAGASSYVALDSAQRYVLATRLFVGSLVGADADQMPPDRLFFAGGGQSVRGYTYRSLGPKRADGTVVGGRSALEGSIELRAKVTENIGVVPFVDAGTAYNRSFPDFSEPLKIGAGIGVRYYTGLGPVRADIAVPVAGGGQGSGVALYLGLGESF